MNGDGIDDLIIGAIGENANILFSANAPMIKTVNCLKMLPVALNYQTSRRAMVARFCGGSIDENDFAGPSVSGAGDVNHDGIDDLIIGTEPPMKAM